MRRLVVVIGLIGVVGLTGRGLMPCELLPPQPRCDVVLHPGPTADTLGAVRIEGARTYASAGQFLLTTVSVDTTLDWREWVAAVASRELDRVPRATVFPPDEDEDEVRERNAAAMDTSQDVAVTAALRVLGMESDALRIEIDAGSIGGPSAGLMFSLGVIDLLTEEDLTGGAVIAGTGTIDEHGVVSPIGGVRQKVRAAAQLAERPATAFLLPASNLDQASSTPVVGRILLVPVNDIDEALAALRVLRTGHVPTGAIALGGGG